MSHIVKQLVIILIVPMILNELRNRYERVYPATFINTTPNVIAQPEALDAFFKKLADDGDILMGSDTCRTNSPAKILMIGDSHTYAKTLPDQLRDSLMKVWNITFCQISKNGVQLKYFLEPKQMNEIIEFRPDLLIVSVGTNEAHDDAFKPEAYKELMREFVSKVIEETDSATTFLFTTPPGSFIYKNNKVHKDVRYKILNDRNHIVATAQCEFCKEHNIAIWDLNGHVGGVAAPRNWRSAGLMRDDLVHYTPDGYILQANLLANALIVAAQKYSKQNSRNL